jgi:hypothetical protein
MTLRIPHTDALEAGKQCRFIPFGDTVLVSSEEVAAYAFSPDAPSIPDGTKLLDHIANLVYTLAMVHIHGIRDMHGMHPGAEKCWIEVTAECQRRLQEVLDTVPE